MWNLLAGMLGLTKEAAQTVHKKYSQNAKCIHETCMSMHSFCVPRSAQTCFVFPLTFPPMFVYRCLAVPLLKPPGQIKCRLARRPRDLPRCWCDLRALMCVHCVCLAPCSRAALRRLVFLIFKTQNRRREAKSLTAACLCTFQGERHRALPGDQQEQIHRVHAGEVGVLPLFSSTLPWPCFAAAHWWLICEFLILQWHRDPGGLAQTHPWECQDLEAGELRKSLPLLGSLWLCCWSIIPDWEQLSLFDVWTVRSV